MNKFYLLILLAICGIPSVIAQDVLSYDWNAPIFEEAKGAMYDTASAYYLKSINRLEMVYNEDGQLEGYQLNHQKVKINNNETLERFNKISFSSYSFNEVISIKARFINKNGKVIELGMSDLKTIEDEEGSYKLLAIEGAESGGIIEYYWIRKGFRNLFGNYTLQNNYPKKRVIFEIINPANLRFIAKSYNGCPNMAENVDTIANTRTLLLDTHDMPGLPNERYSFYDANLQRVEYTIGYNYANNRNRIFNWTQAAQYVANNVLALMPEETKPFNALMKKMKISGKMMQMEKIRYIENYIKTNFQLIPEKIQGQDISTITGITTTKYADKLGYTRLFASTFKHFGIPFEVVITCDKSERKFDKDFDGYNFLDDYLFYFPEIKDFVDPNSMYNRLGIIDNNYIDNDALYLKPVKASGIESLMPIPGHIPENDFTKSLHYTKADVKLNPQEPTAEYTLEHRFSGYTAIFLQPYMNYMDNESKQEFIEEILQANKVSNKLLKWTATNYKPDEWFVKPLIITGTIAGNELVSRAGNDLIFKIGELIGKQVEMYQEKERKLPMELESTHYFERSLSLDIPAGYVISNPEVLKMKAELMINGQPEAYFYSDYTLTGNKLIVTCTEGYKKSWYPVEKYPEFVAVINAAADFNKIVLIFKK